MPEVHEVYATNEQLQRLAAISLDALTGIQFATDVSDRTSIRGCYVMVDDPSRMKFFVIETDGNWRDET